VLADERARAPRIRRVDDGPRRIRPLVAHGTEFGHPQRRRRSARRQRGRRSRDRTAQDPLRRRIVGRVARCRFCDRVPRCCRSPRAHGVHVHGGWLPDAAEARGADRILPDAQPPEARPRDDPQHLHPRPAGDGRPFRGGSDGGRGASVRRHRSYRDISGHDGEPAGRRSGQGARADVGRAWRIRRDCDGGGPARFLSQAPQRGSAVQHPSGARALAGPGHQPPSVLALRRDISRDAARDADLTDGATEIAIGAIMRSPKEEPAMTLRFPIALVLAATAAVAQTQPQPKAQAAPQTSYAIPIGNAVTLDAAKRAAAAASAEARKNNWFMAIAVVDPAGTLVYYEKADTTQLGSAEVAMDKARSAALYK